MTWETRGNTRYYYRSRRIGRHVRKKYVGNGPAAEVIANLDMAERVAVRRQKAEIALLEARVQRSRELMAQLDEEVGQLTTASLLAAGYHQHRGHWRKCRG